MSDEWPEKYIGGRRIKVDPELKFYDYGAYRYTFGRRFYFDEGLAYDVLNSMFKVKQDGLVTKLYKMCLGKKYKERQQQIEECVERLERQNNE